MPLYFAIMKHFESGKADCVEGVMDALRSDYGTYKLFTEKDIEESLACLTNAIGSLTRTATSRFSTKPTISVKT